jgi:hypothetical protein
MKIQRLFGFLSASAKRTVGFDQNRIIFHPIHQVSDIFYATYPQIQHLNLIHVYPQPNKLI